MWESLFFWLCAVAAVGLAFLVILLRNPVHSAVALVGNMFSLAALFALLDAHFLAALQVLVYAGAIMVLILFVIMLLNIRDDELGPPKQTATKAVGGVLVVWAVLILISVFGALTPPDPPAVSEGFGTITTIGRQIFSTYLLPFEVASILLLAAILGAVSIAKKRIW
jgi:NADH-quinone oxidoreductase subunit J